MIGANLLDRRLERVPIAWNHAIEKDSLQINELEHVLVGKPLHTFPGHALREFWRRLKPKRKREPPSPGSPRFLSSN
jgi:hypothetical protein